MKLLIELYAFEYITANHNFKGYCTCQVIQNYVCLGKFTKSKHLCFDYSVALVLLCVKISQPVQYLRSRFEKKCKKQKAFINFDENDQT